MILKHFLDFFKNFLIHGGWGWGLGLGVGVRGWVGLGLYRGLGVWGFLGKFEI